MPPSPPKIYPYHPKATTIILCILFFSACAAVLGWEAATNDRGLILNGIFTLSENGASNFYWVLAALSVGFVFMGVLIAVQRLTGSLSLQITDSAVHIPSGFIKKNITEVAFSDVINLSETAVQGQRLFCLHTPKKKYHLNRALMPSKADYEEAKALITAAIVDLNVTNNEQDVDGQSTPHTESK